MPGMAPTYVRLRKTAQQGGRCPSAWGSHTGAQGPAPLELRDHHMPSKAAQRRHRETHTAWPQRRINASALCRWAEHWLILMA